MPDGRGGWKWVLALALSAVSSVAAASHGGRAAPAFDVEVIDRSDRRTLPVYRKDGRAWIVGTPGHEYALRLRNLTGRRVLAVTSVDGVNVVSGDTAAPSQSGYVIDAYTTLEVAGWRKSLARTAAFYFTDLGDSYAARTGRPDNVGVIGVAAFRERERIVPMQPRVGIEPEGTASPAAGDEARPAEKSRAEPGAPAPAPSLGTGHGRSEWSQAQVVRFERESATPNDLIEIRYDRYENLVAMGVVGAPPIARSPDAFPARPRFVPDPE